MRADTKDALAWTLDYLSRLMAALSGRLGGAEYVRRSAYRALARELSEIEACVRRTLIVFALYLFETGAAVLPRCAGGMEGSDMHHPPVSQTPPVHIGLRPPCTLRAAPEPRFPLLEPLPRYSFDAANWWDTLTPSDRPKDAAPLQRRLAVLGAVLADPEAAARRMARQIARIRTRKLRRTVAIRPDRTNWRGDPLKDVFASIAADMNGRAITGLNALGP